MGHPTVLSDPQTERGYVHSLGHGVGLDVHEAPYLSNAESNRDELQPGAVFTLEPGLYYPDRKMGVRLENTLWMRPDGTAAVVAPYPLDLVLPVRRGAKSRTVPKGKPRSAAKRKTARVAVRSSKKTGRKGKKAR